MNFILSSSVGSLLGWLKLEIRISNAKVVSSTKHLTKVLSKYSNSKVKNLVLQINWSYSLIMDGDVGSFVKT